MRADLFALSVFTFIFSSSVLAQYPTSPKRGLVSVGTNNPQDEGIFVKPNNGLTWYYNYGISPTTAYVNISQSDIEFVPMLWGVSNITGSSFLKNITTMIGKGRNISHVLSFNEPDVNFTAKGSQVSPDAAAASWILNFDPLRKMGIKVGAPVVYANETGFAWLDKFHAACEKRKSNCTADFMNIHVFGNVSVIDKYITTYKKKYPGIPLWITEFALDYSPVLATEANFNQTIALFDNDTAIERYSYFGSFRSSDSGVGWNATMLDTMGDLTNIGSWYLGGGMVGAKTTTSSSSSPAATSSTKSSDGSRGIAGGFGLVGMMMLLSGMTLGL
ncbi:glycosyl hydrolase catalytic core-domain-containing protein [Rhexocercosporidium sp. MPI-PUGE-AT-0058]|nr:glycosyl hydrolase catalytic core-domain-containing protein [Rhexocercosporidium sp. MPI-PUGE-AT-0058]